MHDVSITSSCCWGFRNMHNNSHRKRILYFNFYFFNTTKVSWKAWLKVFPISAARWSEIWILSLYGFLKGTKIACIKKKTIPFRTCLPHNLISSKTAQISLLNWQNSLDPEENPWSGSTVIHCWHITYLIIEHCYFYTTYSDWILLSQKLET